MSDAPRDYGWTAEGRQSAAHNGVLLTETIQALHSTQRVEGTTPDGTLLIVIGLADTARLVTVMCDRLRGTRIYLISTVYLSTPNEITQWRKATS